AFMRMIPHMRVLAPSNEAELVHALHTALALGGPFAVRYPRGAGEGVAVPQEPEVLVVGKANVVRKGDDVAILAFGRMVGRALGAAELLAERGIEARVVDMRWVKPLDAKAVSRAAKTKLVVTVEGGVIAGGAGEGVLGELARQGLQAPVLNLGIQDTFVPQGKTDLLLRDLGLDAEGIAASIEERLARSR
ncbi:MAG: transketolase C-terminal domain-containing protein, partial [Gordonibacter sp.]